MFVWKPIFDMISRTATVNQLDSIISIKDMTRL